MLNAGRSRACLLRVYRIGWQVVRASRDAMLSDAEWELIAPSMPSMAPGEGRPSADHRRGGRGDRVALPDRGCVAGPARLVRSVADGLEAARPVLQGRDVGQGPRCAAGEGGRRGPDRLGGVRALHDQPDPSARRDPAPHHRGRDRITRLPAPSSLAPYIEEAGVPSVPSKGARMGRPVASPARRLLARTHRDRPGSQRRRGERGLEAATRTRGTTCLRPRAGECMSPGAGGAYDFSDTRRPAIVPAAGSQQVVWPAVANPDAGV
jgi:hypothetical protein